MDAQLTAFDVIVLLIVGGTFIYAFVKGFTAMLLTILAWFGAILITLYGLPYAVEFGRSIIEQQTIADLVAVPVLFIVSLAVLKILANFIGTKVKKSPVGFLDRSLGALLGLMLGVVVISSLYLFLDSVIDERRQPEWIQEARLKPLVAYGAEMVAEIGPELLARAEDDEDAQQMLEKMRETYSDAREDALEVGETAYKEAERRLLEEQIRRALEAEEQGQNNSNGERKR